MPFALADTLSGLAKARRDSWTPTATNCWRFRPWTRSDFEAIRRGSEWLRSLTGQRVLRYLATESHRQAGKPNGADILFEGACRGFAERLGEYSNKAPERIAAVLRAGAGFRRHGPVAKSRPMDLNWRRSEAARGQRATLVVTPQLSRAYYAIKKLGADRRFSVPILPEPPFGAGTGPRCARRVSVSARG